MIANRGTYKPKASRRSMRGYVSRFSDQVAVSLFIGLTAVILWLFLFFLPEIFIAIWRSYSFINQFIHNYV